MNIKNYEFTLEEVTYRVQVSGQEDQRIMEVKVKGSEFPDASHFAYILMFLAADLCERMGVTALDQFFGVLDDLAMKKRPKANTDKKAAMN